MRTTDALYVDTTYRYWRKAQTMLDRLQTRWTWYTRHLADEIRPTHQERYTAIRDALKREISGSELTWEINTYLSRRPILKLPVETVMQFVYHNLPQPGPAQLNVIERSVTDLLALRHHQTAQNQAKFRVMCEIAYRTKHNYFLLLNTLTVRQGEYYAVFKPTSKSFKDYIRKIDRITNTGNTQARRQDTGHTYFAVTESGTKHGRLHIHVLHFLQRLPHGTTDPNFGLLTPRHRTLQRYIRFWPHGRSEPKMVRYSPNDAYGQAGFRWPVEDHEPLQVNSPQAAGTYLAHYIEDSFNAKQREKYLWRIKQTHQLGNQILRELTEQLSTSTLIVIASNDSMKIKLNQTQVPQNLLRRACLKTLQNRQYTTHSGHYTLTDMAKLSTPRLSPLHSMRASTETILENSLSSMQLLSTLGLTNEATFELAWQELKRAAYNIDNTYFLRSEQNNGTASTADTVHVGQNVNRWQTG